MIFQMYLQYVEVYGKRVMETFGWRRNQGIKEKNIATILIIRITAYVLHTIQRKHQQIAIVMKCLKHRVKNRWQYTYKSVQYFLLSDIFAGFFFLLAGSM